MTQPIRILIIDTDLDSLDKCYALCARGRSATIILTDSANAMSHFGKTPPDLVLLEIVMPEIDGIELLITIKQRHPATRIIAMSGGGSYLPRDIVLYWASRLGGDAVLPKPIDATQLEKAIHAIFCKQPRVCDARDASHE